MRGDVIEYGDAILNDETIMPKDTPALTPANQNPWYVLMTLYGEEDGTLSEENREKNKKVWNSVSHLGRGNEAAYEEIGLPISLEAMRGIDISSGVEMTFVSVWTNRNPSIPKPRLPNRGSTVDLSSTEFTHPLVVDGFIFDRGIDLSNSHFRCGISAKRTGFSEPALLTNARLLEDANFNGAVFLRDFDGNGAEVGGNFNLKNTQIRGSFTFPQAIVDGEFAAAGLTVGGAFDVFNGTFGSVVDLRDAKFGGHASFMHARINDHAYFNTSTFSSDVNFIWTEFRKEANFAGVTFERRSIFRNTKFHNLAGFTSCSFLGLTDFSEACFLSAGNERIASVRYNDSHFAKPTSFRNAQFLQSYPEFTNVDFHPVTDFSADSDNTKHWPNGVTEPRKQARETCGIIRNLLAKKGLHEDQHFFFRKEMQFAAASANRRERFTYQVYRWLSDYGDSIQRPLLYLLFIWVVGWLSFGGYLLQTPQFLDFCFQDVNRWPNEPLRPYGTGAALSFSNLFPPFGFSRTFFGNGFMACLPVPLKVYSGFQTVVSLPLLFFLGLGLRQRFRLR